MKNVFEKVKDFVLKHKKLSIISACVVAALIVILICILVFGGNNEPVETPESKLRKHIDAKVTAFILIRYDTTGVVPRITTLREKSDGVWEAYGKVSARDKFGDSYTGTFEGECKAVEDDFECDFEYSNLYKD